jgi:2-polyprenyl-3-methyl-5-hydroxy-6-metoxy-1,4-benzoquinol methylase
METIDCIFCGPAGAPDPVVIRENGFEGHRCARCQLIYISPRPSTEEISNLYAHDEAKTGAAVLKGDEYNRRLAAKQALRMLRPQKRSGTLLEVGAGMGFFSDEARSAGYTPYAIELNHVQAAHCETQGIPTDRRPLAEAYPGMKFDIVYHCDVLSHFTDPVAEFKRMVSRLNPGGLLMFETGNFGDVSPAYYHFIRSFQYPDHLFFFSRASLGLLLERSGLKATKIRRFGRLAEMMIQKKLGRDAGPGPEPGAVADAVAGKTRLKQKVKQWIRHLLIYKIGALHPLKNAPQTLVVIATPS